MNNTFYLVCNAEAEVDRKIPISKWKLTTRGKLHSEMLAKDKILSKADVIITSGEDKALETAAPLARKKNKKIDRFTAFNELMRDKGDSLTAETFNFAVKYALKNPDKSKFGWEKASRALDRFTQKIKEIDLAYNNRKILIVSHRLVISMYFATLLGKLHIAYERAIKTKFCDYGIIKDNKVIQDIIR